MLPIVLPALTTTSRARAHWLFFVWCSSLVALLLSASSVAADHDAFAAPAHLPAQVSGFISMTDMEDASRLISQSSLGPSWTAFWGPKGPQSILAPTAAKLGLDPALLWRELTSSDLLLIMVRPAPTNPWPVLFQPAQQSPGWVVSARVREEVFQRWLRAGDGRVSAWVGQIAIFHLASTGADLAYSDGWMYLSDPGDRDGLTMLLSAHEPAARLAADPAFIEARLLGSGHCAMFMRSPVPTGWIAVTLEVHPEGAQCRMLVKHCAMPSPDLPARLPDWSALRWLDSPDALPGLNLIALSVDRLPSSAEIRAQTADPTLAPIRATPMGAVLETATDLADRMGPTAVCVVAAATDGPAAAWPALTWAAELPVATAPDAAATLDGIMKRAASAAILAANFSGKIQLPVPSQWPDDPNAVRIVDLSAVTSLLDWSTKGFADPAALPRFSDLALVWSQVTAPDGRVWWLVSTSLSQHERVTAALAALPEKRATDDMTISRGLLSGRTLAQMLDRWSAISPLAPADAPSRAQALREILRSLRVTWDMRRTSPKSEEGAFDIRWPAPTPPDPAE